MLLRYGTHILKNTSLKLKWSSEGLLVGLLETLTTDMLNKLGWRTLEQRRADARLCLFYKIDYGLVAVPLPNYVQYNNRISRYCHSMTFRQDSTSTDYYKYSFFPSPLFSGMPSLSLLYAYRVWIASRLLSVSCNTLDHNPYIACY